MKGPVSYARFAEVISRLDGLTVRMDALPKPVGFWQIAGMVVSAMAVGFSLLGVFADRFDGGIAASGLLDRLQEVQSERDATQDAKLDKILEAVNFLASENKNQPGNP